MLKDQAVIFCKMRGEKTVCESRINESISVRLRRYSWAIAAFWTAFVVTVLLWNLLQQKSNIMELARKHAQAFIEKDIVYRDWNTRHGGVYVPVSEWTPPNPDLSHVEDFPGSYSCDFSHGGAPDGGIRVL